MEGQEEFDGQFDEVRLWSDVRTAAEIRENMCKTLVGDEAGLVGYYNFDRERDTDLPDFSGEDNDGTLTNMEDADWVASTAFNTWLNTDNSAWATTSNWSQGAAPGATDNVGVYSYSGSTQPSVATPGYNTLVVGTGATLTTTGNVTNAAGKTAFILGDMTIGGTFSNSGTFTIPSSSSGTGSVIFTGTATGNVKVERFLTHDRWHYISGQTNISGNFSTLSMDLSGGTDGDRSINNL